MAAFTAAHSAHTAEKQKGRRMGALRISNRAWRSPGCRRLREGDRQQSEHPRQSEDLMAEDEKHRSGDDADPCAEEFDDRDGPHVHQSLPSKTRISTITSTRPSPPPP